MACHPRLEPRCSKPWTSPLLLAVNSKKPVSYPNADRTSSPSASKCSALTLWYLIRFDQILLSNSSADSMTAGFDHTVHCPSCLTLESVKRRSTSAYLSSMTSASLLIDDHDRVSRIIVIVNCTPCASTTLRLTEIAHSAISAYLLTMSETHPPQGDADFQLYWSHTQHYSRNQVFLIL